MIIFHPKYAHVSDQVIWRALSCRLHYPLLTKRKGLTSPSISSLFLRIRLPSTRVIFYEHLSCVHFIWGGAEMVYFPKCILMWAVPTHPFDMFSGEVNPARAVAPRLGCFSKNQRRRFSKKANSWSSYLRNFKSLRLKWHKGFFKALQGILIHSYVWELDSWTSWISKTKIFKIGVAFKLTSVFRYREQICGCQGLGRGGIRSLGLADANYYI